MKKKRWMIFFASCGRVPITNGHRSETGYTFTGSFQVELPPLVLARAKHEGRAVGIAGHGESNFQRSVFSKCTPQLISERLDKVVERGAISRFDEAFDRHAWQ